MVENAPPKNVPIALLAGRGDLPRNLIQIFQKQSRPFFIVAFHDQTDKAIVKDTPHEWLHFGEVGKALKIFHDHQIKEIVMAGNITRPTLRSLRPDWIGVKWLARLGTKALGDDSILKKVISMIEGESFKVVAPHDILNDLLAPEGVITLARPDDQAWQDIERGVEILSALDPVDVGQATVVQEGLVLGVEAIEGTEALIKRAGELKRDGIGGVLVKLSKRQQEVRADLPTIGIETLKQSYESGLRGIAFEAGRSILLNKEDAIKYANEKGLFLIGLASHQCHKNP